MTSLLRGEQLDEDLRAKVRALFNKPVAVLEAGGGSRFCFDVPDGSAITVIDISAEQLERNSYATHKILGDLETVDMGKSSFDLIIFRNVLEHLSTPQIALDHAAAAARPGGLIVIGGPIVSSARGLVTKLTPHFVHVMFFRHAMGWANSGKPGYAPFPAYNRWFTHPDSLRKFLTANGFKIVFYEPFASNHAAQLKRKSKPLYAFYLLVSWALRIISLGRLGALESDFRLMAQKA
jgi:SAM-dependent methyltransferase